jgi:hypothetical protein
LFCNVNNEEWPASGFSTVLQSITAALRFPFPFSFVWAALHYSAKWTVESDRPLAFPLSFNPSSPRCSSPSPSPLFGLLSTVLQSEQWRVSPLFMVVPGLTQT